MKLAKMPVKKRFTLCLKPLFLGLFLLSAAFLTAQQSYRAQYFWKYENAGRLFNAQRMAEAAAEFRGAQEMASSLHEWAQALYWVILSELSLGDYDSALKDMDELDKYAPNSSFASDMVYHRARAYFNQGYFEDALILFKNFNDRVSPGDPQGADRKAASFFWMGECLYLMGQFDEAERFYSWVVTKYPGSPKKEVSSYRIDLIKQKKIEAELLELLRWRHEESLRTSEEYQRKLKTYEHTLNSYQRRGESSPVAPGGTSIQDNFQEQSSVEDIKTPPVVNNEAAADANRRLNEDLLEKARRLGDDIQVLISELDTGGGTR
jgi:tetratricopeptide (TPR) repeat protein